MVEKLKEFYINNTTGVDQAVTIKKEISCAVFDDVDTFLQVVTANTESKILFPSDGIYQVYVDGTLDGTASYYLTLFNSTIVYVLASLCGNTATNCLTVTSCAGDVPNYLNNAISKVILYMSVSNPKYDDGLNLAIQKIRCSALDVYTKLMIQEQTMGVSYTDELLKIELSHLIMEMHTQDHADALSADRVALDELYNWDELSYCIRKLGVMDCEAPPLPPGVLHSTAFTATPATIGLGVPSDITISYKFTANDDVFVSVIDTNVPNVSIGKFDGFTHNEIIVGETTATNYYITYSYTRGGETYQNTVTDTTVAYAPQWFGGESTTADFTTEDGKAYAATVDAQFTNISAVYKSNSNGISSNTNTVNKYIYWVTKNPIRFYIGAFEIQTGPWSDSCNPTAFAIITKTINTVMEDGISEQVLHYYRTCPLQDLSDKTITYDLKQ